MGGRNPLIWRPLRISSKGSRGDHPASGVAGMLRSRLSLVVPIAGLLFVWQAQGQVRPRITARPDDGAVARIPGSTHPLTALASQLGRVSGEMPMERMV